LAASDRDNPCNKTEQPPETRDARGKPLISKEILLSATEAAVVRAKRRAGCHKDVTTAALKSGPFRHTKTNAIEILF
jgi:hypothetical protein